jgi:hypothetical protein
MAFFGISLSSALNSTSVGTRSRRPQQLPRMIVINSGRMSCRYSADAARALVAEYLDGTTAAEIGRRYGGAKSSVLQLVRQAG